VKQEVLLWQQSMRRVLLRVTSMIYRMDDRFSFFVCALCPHPASRACIDASPPLPPAGVTRKLGQTMHMISGACGGRAQRLECVGRRTTGRAGGGGWSKLWPSSCVLPTCQRERDVPPHRRTVSVQCPISTNWHLLLSLSL
jgi:hypothetical protein